MGNCIYFLLFLNVGSVDKFSYTLSLKEEVVDNLILKAFNLDSRHKVGNLYAYYKIGCMYLCDFVKI